MRFLHLCAFYLITAALPAEAFDTPIHGDITREALSRTGIDQTGIKFIVAGNLSTDTDPVLYNTMHAHFCNEEFSRGSRRLREKLVESVDALAACDRQRALVAMGTSLHATQDFYAHSNEINLYRDPGVTVDLFHLQDPGRGVVCSPGHLPPVLTSAYWPDNGYFPGKCTHAQIAKDLPNVGPAFYVARARALRATALYFQVVERMLDWVFDDASSRTQFLKTGGACRPAGGPLHSRETWLPRLSRLMASLPGVVRPSLLGE